MNYAREYKMYFKSGKSEDLTGYAHRKLIKSIKLDSLNIDKSDSHRSLLSDQHQQQYEIPITKSEKIEKTLEDQPMEISTDCIEYEDPDQFLINEVETDFTFLQRDQESDSDEDSTAPEYFLPDILSDDDDDDEIFFKNKKFKPDNLRDLLNSDGFSKVISTSINTSQSELLLMILKFSVVNKLPQTTLSNLLSLFNSMFVKEILPQSRYMLDKLCPAQNTTFHVTCPICLSYASKLEDFNPPVICSICRKEIKLSSSHNNLFAIIDPSIAIAELLNTYEDYYDDIVHLYEHDNNNIRDIYDGKKYIEFLSSLSEENRYQYVTVTFNSDGAAPFKSSSFSLWPLYLMVNELPVQDRFNNLIPCLLWFNKKKPNMSVFLDIFTELFKKLEIEGIDCTIKGEKRNIKLYALVCCVDSVARAPMQGHTQFNGKYGCNWCTHPTKWVVNSTKYPLLPNVPEYRDKITAVKQMAEITYINEQRKKFKKNSRIKKNICGFESVSPLIRLPGFDIIDGFVPDYMHCVLAGVGKQITEYLIEPKNISFFQKHIDSFKVPHQICRLTRPLTDRNYWKAREWENWILYYSLPLYTLKIDKKFISYWSLLVESLYILLQSNITLIELDRADELLHIFVSKTEEYFSASAMTFNVHQLLHICRSVRNWGPLWAHSAFAFESGNHVLLQAIKCAKGVISQILRYINLCHTVSILEKQIIPTASEVVKKYCYDIVEKKVKKFVKTSSVTYFGRGVNTDNSIKTALGLSTDCKSYFRMVKNGCLYCSYLRSTTRSNNSIARLFNGNYIRILNFIVDLEKQVEVTVCNIIKVSRNNFGNNNCKIERVRLIDNELMYVPTEDIQSICVLIQAGKEEYICLLPNLYIY